MHPFQLIYYSKTQVLIQMGPFRARLQTNRYGVPGRLIKAPFD